MITFISFGSGSSGNCYWLSTAQGAILIDAGVGIRTLKRLIREYGVSLSSVQALFVTHDHADHIKAVGHLGEKYHIPVYTTAQIHSGIQRSYCMTQKLKTSAHNLTKEVPVEVGSFKVTAFEVPHDGTDNVGYQIEVEGVTFCFATDLGEILPSAASYMARANYLVVEANYDIEMLQSGHYPPHLKKRIVGPRGHLSNYETANFIASIVGGPLKRVWLCHLSDENNHPELALKTVESVLHTYGLRLGVDVEVEPLKRQLPMRFDLPTSVDNP